MRIASYTSNQGSVSTLQQRQQSLQQAQEQMTSGKRIARPSDDPAGIATAERALNAQKRTETAQRALAASRNAMTLSESSIGQAIDLTQGVRESLLNAGNGSYSASDRNILAQQLRQLRGQLLSVANQSDGATGFVFGGQGATTQPFSDTVDGVVSGTTGGVSNASPNENMPLSVDGAAVWLHARSGNGVFVTAAGDVDGEASRNTGTGWINAGQVNDPSRYTGKDYQLVIGETGGKPSYSITEVPGVAVVTDQPFQSGKAITDIAGISFNISGTPAPGDSFMVKPSTADLSVFGAIDKVLATLGDKSANSGQVMQAVNSGLRDVDQVLSNFQSARSVAGEALNHLDGMESRNSAAILSAQTTRSNAEDLDMVQAVSDFNNKQTSYQAALQSYTMVQKLSLFNYINT